MQKITIYVVKIAYTAEWLITAEKLLSLLSHFSHLLLLEACQSDWNIQSTNNPTKYDTTKTDKTYAHIDGGTSNPGYFTAK